MKWINSPSFQGKYPSKDWQQQEELILLARMVKQFLTQNLLKIYTRLIE